MTSWFKKLLLLSWKNWIIQIRHPISMIMELFIPIFICATLCVLRSIMSNKKIERHVPGPYDPIGTDNSIMMYKTIAFSPTNTKIENLLSNAIKELMEIKLINIDNSNELEKYLLQSTEPNVVGIEFEDALKNKNDEIPKKMNFALRFPVEANGILLTTQEIYRRKIDRGSKDLSEYKKAGFLTLLSIVSKAIIDYHNKDNKSIPNILLQEFPYPSIEMDPLPAALYYDIDTIFIVIYIYSVINITSTIAEEKEKLLKESMKLAGVYNWIHWTAWFLKAILFLSISNVLMVILLKIDVWYPNNQPAVFQNTDFMLLFIFLFLFSCAIITFCFMITTIFTNASLASSFVWIIFYFIVMPAKLIGEANSSNQVIALIGSISFTTAMSFGTTILIKFENMGVGVQWNNIWIVCYVEDVITFGEILIILLLDAILYMLIALYLEAVFPGKAGIPKKWYFIFTCCSFKKRKATVNVENANEDNLIDNTAFEPDPKDLKPGITIQHLHKAFASNKVAVKDLDLIMYENQITVLLGHNGAGKTTSISMLAGSFKPTSGTAIINGFDINADPLKARDSMGICPQHNVLFDELTVREHIYFYAKLKGMKKDELVDEVYNILKLLNMQDKINSKSYTLSGGMKRKLSVAIAFTGNPKVVMLDEPTAGMDPGARRTLWKFIEFYKEDRTILLTTHFMDEADLLGDRIAIMCGGKLQCCGGSFFLKKKYGSGYSLIIAKTNDCEVDEITKLLRTFIPNINVESDIGSELTYLLKKEYSDMFENLLKNLERHHIKLGIESYGISLTTIEEVFMKVGKEVGTEDESNETVEKNPDRIKLLTGSKLIGNQLHAMATKRMLIAIRSWKFLLIQIAFCVCLVLAGILVDRRQGFKIINLKINTDLCINPTAIISTTNNENKYYSIMTSLLQNVDIININGDIINEIEKRTSDDEIYVRNYYVVGAQFEQDKIIGLYSDFLLHSSPLILNIITNSIIKSLDPDCEINLNNHPYQFGDTIRRESTNFMSQTITQAFSIVIACSILIYINERICNAKHLQLISGLRVLTFWLVSIIWDFLVFCIVAIIAIILILCFQPYGYRTFDEIQYLIVIFLCFQYAMFPIAYLFSLYFNSAANGFIVVLIIGASGYVLQMVYEILKTQVPNVANILVWILRLNPAFCLQNSIANQHYQYILNSFCTDSFDTCMNQKPDEQFCRQLLTEMTDKCANVYLSYYAWEPYGILPDLIYCILIGTILYILLFIIELKIISKLIYICKKSREFNEDSVLDDDIDVQKEIFRINNFNDYDIKQHALVVINLKKKFKKMLAVDGTCLAINRAECFGLLGVTGAGKTTTFKILTGDIPMSSGEVYVDGLDLKRQPKEINKLIGYCPQFDALFEELTPKETIKLYAMIRGFSSKDGNKLSHYLANKYGFSKHLKKRVKQLSGGNKRKVSTAVSLIGNPIIVYLDEPTAGMDPASKRYIWNQLCNERDNGKSLIITSHSMEEVEAICTRLTIMVKGKFKCLGSKQHLKSRFSPGYTITIKLRKKEDEDTKINVKKMDSFIKKNFEQAELKQNYQEMMEYYILDLNLSGSKIFAVMDHAKTQLNIEDYSISQSSLEDVFLRFIEDDST